MLSIIIPVLNEEKTIGNVVQFCFRNPLVNDVIVVDDRSEDHTVQAAENAGAKVINEQYSRKGCLDEGWYCSFCQ